MRPKRLDKPPQRSVSRQQAVRRAAQRRRLLRLLASAVVVAVIAVIVLIALNRNDMDDVEAAPALDSGIPTAGRTMGDPNAPVRVVEWGDYQCPHCAAFAQEIEPRLIADYVKTGKVAFEFRNFAFLDRAIHQSDDGSWRVMGDGESVRAAEAAACASDQGRFWRFHATLFANHQGENEGAYSADRLRTMADVIGLDTAAFGDCMDAHAHRDGVVEMYAEAQQAGINSTPTILVNGVPVPVGAYGDLTAAIDAALAAAP